ncbi:MAG TPA: nucleotide pyrophosphohydrolase [Candidatus Ozemobacteraceae bacterium]
MTRQSTRAVTKPPAPKGTTRTQPRSATPPDEGPKPFSDHVTTVEALKDLVREFITEREWASYHTPKNVAASVAIEAAELLEHFQWVHPSPEELSRDKRGEIADEMADVLAYLLSLSNILGIDLAAALQQKMGKNRRKYPADRFRGTWEKVRS